jgi:glycosyltransferase involved in cell wall biosynthesis
MKGKIMGKEKASIGSSIIDKISEYLSIFKRKGLKRNLNVCFVYFARFNNNAVLYREAKAMKAKGFDVDILCLRVNQDEKIFEVIDGLNVYKIQLRKFNEKSSIIYFVRLALFYIKSTFFLSTVGILRGYDIVHITSPPDIMVFSAIIPKLAGSRIILDIHDIGPELYMRKLNAGNDRWIIKLLRQIEKISSRFADHVITVTDIWKEKLSKRSVAPSKCTVLLNVPDGELFKPLSRKDNKLSNNINLYYHGTLDEHFGVDTLIKAMPLIKKSIPRVRLNIYGGGRKYDDLISLAHQLEILDYVSFNDFVSFFKLPSILSEADLGIVPTKDSVFSDEALSMKSLEYISLGIPIVISRTRAHSYYFKDDMVKYFKAGNHEDLAKSVIGIINNPEEQKRLVANTEEFMKKHNWNVYREKYFMVIDQLLNKNNDRPE